MKQIRHNYREPNMNIKAYSTDSDIGYIKFKKNISMKNSIDQGKVVYK